MCEGSSVVICNFGENVGMCDCVNLLHDQLPIAPPCTCYWMCDKKRNQRFATIACIFLHILLNRDACGCHLTYSEWIVDGLWVAYLYGNHFINRRGLRADAAARSTDYIKPILELCVIAMWIFADDWKTLLMSWMKILANAHDLNFDLTRTLFNDTLFESIPM